MSLMLRAVVSVGLLVGGTGYPRLQAAPPPAPIPSTLSAQAASSPSQPAASPERALLLQYCITCHSDRGAERGTVPISLQHLDPRNVSADAEAWEKVVRKLRTATMPPAGSPRPDRATYDSFASTVEAALDRVASANPKPGRVPAVHRLNRFEYTNAIRDLLALDIDGDSMLPADESGYGFDNIANVLALTPALLERYLLAARKIGRLAVGDPTMRPAISTYKMSLFKVQDYRESEDLPFGTRGGTAIRHLFPLDGEYVLRIRLRTNWSSPAIRGIENREQIDVRLDGARINLFNIGGECIGSKEPRCLGGDTATLATSVYERTADQALEVRFPAKAGTRLVGVAFVNRNVTPEGAGPEYSPPRHSSFISSVEGGMAMDSVMIEGPLNAAGPGDTPSRRQIFVCQPTSPSERSGAGLGGPRPSTRPGRPELVEGRKRSEPSGAKGPPRVNTSGAARGAGAPASGARLVSGVQGSPRVSNDEEGCARKILSTLARRAYRRPVTDRDVEPLLSLYRGGRRDGDFEAGIQLALEGLLVSPNFLLRVERDPANVAPAVPYRISDLELASRLSFFLWSSIPDEKLLDVAVRGGLKDPKILDQHVRRMLTDRRADALVSNFSGQWLQLRNMRMVEPDPRVYPDFDDSLREAFITETELFLESQMREDRGLLELLTADHTFVNERLARFYGIPNVYGSHFRRVTSSDPHRQGLLGQGSILTLTSYSTRTSPVVRGKYLLDNIVGAPPPPPPANVPPLPESGQGRAATSMRERMGEHRKNPICASCHMRMDPLGFALENFDGIGKWRTREANTPIDAAGVLPDGTKFDGPAEFRNALVAQQQEFVRTFTEKLLTYALGRGVEYSDAPAVRKIIRDAAPTEYRWSSLILGIVRSTPFQMRTAAQMSAPPTATVAARP